MTTYRVEMMTDSDYCKYMKGGYNYKICKVDIEANTAEEAVEIAKNNNPKMIVNTGYVRTVAELEEMEAKRLAEREAYRKSEEERKAKARACEVERERMKAEALGLTVEEYKAKVEHDKEVSDIERQIVALKTELAKKEEYLEKLKKEA